MDFFKNEQSLKKIVRALFKKYHNSKKKHDIHKNVIDPFSAMIEASFNNLDYSTWINAEKARQIQKSFQNDIGKLHENIIGEIKGFERLQVGNIIDIVSKEKKIIAEVKNKFNTTKGNHKMEIYDDIKYVLNLQEYNNYTGYYVEIIPQTPKPYNKPFTPSDNKRKTKRETNEKIRQIDGKSFYALATGDPLAIYKIYDAIIQELEELGCNVHKEFRKLLYMAYGKP